MNTRNGFNFSKRFPPIVAAVAAAPARSCLIEGEAIVSNGSGLAVFDPRRSWRRDACVCAFDVIELDVEARRMCSEIARSHAFDATEIERDPSPRLN